MADVPLSRARVPSPTARREGRSVRDESGPSLSAEEGQYGGYVLGAKKSFCAGQGKR